MVVEERKQAPREATNCQGGRSWDSLVLVELPTCHLTTEKKEHEAWNSTTQLPPYQLGVLWCTTTLSDVPELGRIIATPRIVCHRSE